MTSIGRWVPVTSENAAAVLAQVNEFVDSFRMMSGCIPAPDMAETAERRIQQMLKSAELRLDVITAYVDGHPNGRHDKLMAAARALTVILAHEGVGAEKEVVPGPNTGPGVTVEPSTTAVMSAVVSAIAGAQKRPRSGSVSFMCQQPQLTPQGVLAQQQTSFRSGRSSPTSPQRRKGHSVSPMSPGVLGNASIFNMSDEVINESVPDVRQVVTPMGEGENRMEMYIQQLRTREDALKYKLQFSTEREQAVLQKLLVMEAENLRLERALVEVNESRERMKGIVEEQVYTQALHTRLMGLLHLERNRTSKAGLTRGVLFWCSSILALLYIFTTSASPIVSLYTTLRSSVAMVLPFWTCLVLDCAIVSMFLALTHEWVSYAIYDICNGCSNWLINTLSAYTEEQAVITDDVRSVSSSSISSHQTTVH